MPDPKLWTCDGCGKRAHWDRATWRWWPGVEARDGTNAPNVKPGCVVPAVACGPGCEDRVLSETQAVGDRG